VKTGDLVYWRLAVWKQNPATKKRLGKVPCKILTDVGIILSKRTHDTYDVMFSGNKIAKGVWEKELEVISESR
jgi:hypothetical protein